MANLRGATKIHNNAALANGVATTKYAYVGSAVNVAVYIISDTTTTMILQATTKSDGTVSAGMNTDLSSSTWCNLSGYDNITVTANIPLVLNISPFAPQYVRALNKSGGTNIVALTVLVEASG